MQIINKTINIDACSQSVLVRFTVDVPVSEYAAYTGSGTVKQNVTLQTSLYKSGTQYILVYNIGANNSSQATRTTTLTITSAQESDTCNIIQSYNYNASSITNIRIYDYSGNELQKDNYNRFIIPESYSAGSQFTINYDYTYYFTEPSINISTYETIGNMFIDTYYNVQAGVAKFEINSNSGDTQILQLDFDDTYNIGAAVTYIPITRKAQTTGVITTNINLTNITAAYYVTTLNLQTQNILTNTITVSASSWITITKANDVTYYVEIQANTSASSRTGSINVSGTAIAGDTVSISIPVSQVAAGIPYIGNAAITTEYNGQLLPTISCSFNGKPLSGSNTFTLYNTKDTAGNPTYSNIKFYLNSTQISNIKYTDMPNTQNGNISVTSNFEPNYTSEQTNQIVICRVTMKDGSVYNINMLLSIGTSAINICEPIWKDIYVSLNKKYFRFLNVDTGELLYMGINYNVAGNKINIRNILESFINLQKTPFTQDVYFNAVGFRNNKMINAVLQTSDVDTFIESEDIAVYHLYWNYDYNYENRSEDEFCLVGNYMLGYNTMAGDFYNPIEYYDSRQLVFAHVPVYYTNQASSVSKVYGNDTQLIYTVPNNFKGDVYTVICPGDYNNIKLQTSDGSLWDVGYQKCTNADYAVYYLNSAGIWCWMLFEGKQIENIKTTQKTYLTDNSNDKPWNIHNAIYNINVNDTFDLTSVYLTDKQSRMLKDLYISPLVYVQDLNTLHIYSVNVATNSYDVKSFNNQGKRFFTHNIKLTKTLTKNINI